MAQGQTAVPRFGEFVTAVAYHFCLALPAAFTQPGTHLLAKFCSCQLKYMGLASFYSTPWYQFHHSGERQETAIVG